MKRLFLALLLLLCSFAYAQTANDVVRNRPYERMNIDPWNIYYGFNKAEPLPESFPLLDTLVLFMKQNPLTSVEIYSYTDGKGDNEYNINLSQRRALAVMEYLQKMNIARERMSAKGFGSRNIVAYEFTTNGEDNPQGRALNRRTEIRIYNQPEAERIIINEERAFDDDDQTQPRERNILIPLE